MTGIRIAASNEPIDVAWAAFDAAAIRFHRMYGRAAYDDDAVTRADRMAQAQTVVRLWDEWRALFIGGGDEPSAA